MKLDFSTEARQVMALMAVPSAVLLLVLIGPVVLGATTGSNHCELIDPSRSWAEWVTYYTSGCFWD